MQKATRKYDIKLRFPALRGDAETQLAVANARLTARVAKGAVEHTFEAVPIASGEIRLLAGLTTAEGSKGPWQVDVGRSKNVK